MRVSIVRNLFLSSVFLAATALTAIAGEQVNINTASAEALSAALSGVGEARAQAIVDYREENGPFASVEELADVSGIGAATLEANRERIVAE